MFFVHQVYAILISIALAYLNKVPCEKFRDNGTSLKEDKLFHQANFIVKVLFAFFICGLHPYSFIAASLWMWLMFDPSLNLFIDNRWYYNGETAKTDKLLNRVFGEMAGLWKAIIVTFLIVAINVLYVKYG